VARFERPQLWEASEIRIGFARELAARLRAIGSNTVISHEETMPSSELDGERHR